MKRTLRKTPHFLVAFLTVLLLSGAFSIVGSLSAQQKKEEPAKEVYTRPTPTRPTVPTIPDANKYQEDKVFLENADSLFRPGNMFEETQIVKGNVKFRQGGMWMFCDSAYYFPERNSLDAFGHVRMEQGDTLFVFADRLVYDGGNRHAVLTDGPSQADVIMKDSQTTLTTDSLDYDMIEDIGWYAVGGTLDDGVNTLTSVFGQYSPSTKKAEFRQDVVLVNNADGYRMFTEELFYDTGTNIAEINTSTRIEGETDTILTTSGWYDTRTDNANLTSRSTIIHRDSADNVITLEGDSIIYDKERHVSEAFMFRNPDRDPRPMVLTDTARRMTLIGGYGLYNDSLQKSLAADYPLLMEYSRPDTLFLRSDTIMTYMKTELVWPDSLAREWNAATRARLHAFKSALEIADSMPVRLYTSPEWLAAPGMAPHLETLPHISFFKASKDHRAAPGKETSGDKRGEVPQQNVPQPDSTQPEPQLQEVLRQQSDTQPAPIPADFDDGSGEIVANDSMPKIRLPRLDKLGRDSNFMVEKEFHAAKAIGKARFFNKDIQGIADTIIYHQFDSLMHLRRKPVVWSGERQVFGDTIKVHFNDSVVDRAFLPAGGMVIEHVDEEFYNQLSGSVLTAYFDNNELKRLYVDGNVETILLPMENDSTYANVVYSEGSYLNVEMDGKNLSRLTMWPDVEGTVTPIFLIKKNDQKYLRGFKWLEMLRPRREWYGDRMVWGDELGEIPEELKEYFSKK